MDKKLKQTLLVVAFGVVLFAAVMHLNSVWTFVANVAKLLLPVGIGLLCAFILNVPMNGFERLLNRLFARAKHKPGHKALRMISLLLTLLVVAAIIAALSTTIIPQGVRTVKSIIALVEENWPAWVAFLEEKGVDTAFLTQWEKLFDLQKLLDKLGSNAQILAGSIANAASATVSTITSVAFGIIIAIYVLADKDTLARQSKKLLYANLKKELADKICHVGRLITKTYAKFLSGQCVEALILGTLILAAFLISGLPYAGLVAMVTAICALIPYIGAFISCVLAVILSLLISPAKALLCLAVYLGVQFVENQFIYPHVVGGSVGLSPLWTLVAVLLGGKLFGLVGMVLFIPLTAVVYELIRDRTNQKLADRHIDVP